MTHETLRVAIKQKRVNHVLPDGGERAAGLSPLVYTWCDRNLLCTADKTDRLSWGRPVERLRVL